MKQITIFLIIILVGFSCGQKSNKSLNTNSDTIDIDKNLTKTDSDIDDSLTEKVIIHNTQIIDNKFYIAYSKYSLEKDLKYDMSFYYDGHYINSYDLENLPPRKGLLFDFNKLISKDSAILIGEFCSHDDYLKFERFMKMPDSDSIIYIYAIKLDCSDWRTHMIIEKVDNHFKKLFEIESTDDRLDFNIQSDSILTCEYDKLFEDKLDTYKFKYDFLNGNVIE